MVGVWAFRALEDVWGVGFQGFKGSRFRASKFQGFRVVKPFSCQQVCVLRKHRDISMHAECDGLKNYRYDGLRFLVE